MRAINMVGITKTFPGVIANDNIDFEVKKGEIHCLLGENGTGKFTLMNVLFGLHKPDKGEIYVNEKLANITNPNDAFNLGIGMVHQHFMLVNQMTVLENIIMGNEKGGFFLDLNKNKKSVDALVKEYDFKLDLDSKVVDLSVGVKQRVEIIKILYRGADIIILDEPTAVLTPQEVTELFKILRKLRENGKTIIFITHKLNETMEISDRVTVLRKGKKVTTVNTKDTNQEELARYMVGRDVETVVTDGTSKTDEVVLELKNVRLMDKASQGINLTIRAGEIVGVAGVEGNGQLELEEMIVGTQDIREGQIYFNSTEITNLSIKSRKEMGIGYIPSDRHKRAMLSDISILENYLLGYQDKDVFVNRGFVKYDELKQRADKLVDEYEIKIPSLDANIGTLSGGNQQKVILSREVSHDPKLIIAAQPTRGLDIGAIEYVHKTLLRLKKEGKAILLISAELPEILNLSDRIVVLYEGEINAQFNNGECKTEEIGLYMAGKRQEVLANE